MKVLKSKKEFQDFYKDKAVVSEYDEKRFSTAKKRFVREIEQYCATAFVPENSKILEIGVGTGFISKALAHKGKLVGIDSSDAMLEQAKKTLAGINVKLQKGDVFELDLGQKFDRIVSVRVFLHFDEKDSTRALKVLSRHLAADGRIIIDFESKSVFKRIVGFFRRQKVTREVENFQFSKQQIQTVVEKAGLVAERFIAIDHVILVSPFLLLGEWTGMRFFEKWAATIDKGLFWFGQGNTRWFVVCKK